MWDNTFLSITNLELEHLFQNRYDLKIQEIQNLNASFRLILLVIYDSVRTQFYYKTMNFLFTNEQKSTLNVLNEYFSLKKHKAHSVTKLSSVKLGKHQVVKKIM